MKLKIFLWITLCITGLYAMHSLTQEQAQSIQKQQIIDNYIQRIQIGTLSGNPWAWRADEIFKRSLKDPSYEISCDDDSIAIRMLEPFLDGNKLKLEVRAAFVSPQKK